MDVHLIAHTKKSCGTLTLRTDDPEAMRVIDHQQRVMLLFQLDKLIDGLKDIDGV